MRQRSYKQSLSDLEVSEIFDKMYAKLTISQISALNPSLNEKTVKCYAARRMCGRKFAQQIFVAYENYLLTIK